MPMPKDTLLAKNPVLPEIDPITAQVIAGALEGVTLEMGHNLTRMSYSSIIRESEDFGAAICDPFGRQLAECPLSTPLQLGPIPGYLRGMFGYMELQGDEFYPGDVFLHNHPYYGATHGADFGIGVPVFNGEELIGFSVTTAHVLDLGALSPGSSGIIDAMDAYAEGLQFIGIKLFERGVRNKYVWRLLEQNIRSPEMVIGDIEAQVATAQLGAERYLELINRFGYLNILAASDYMMNYSERMLRRAISKLPDGVYYAEGYCDGYQMSDNPNEKDMKIAVTLTINGDEIIVDLTGSAEQVHHRPFNMPFHGTTDMAIYVTIRSVLLDSALMEYVPHNEGLTRPIKIIAPKGCIANPIFPAPTIGRFCTSNVLSDVVLRTLTEVAPQNICAGTGNVKTCAYSGEKNGNYWVFMDITEGSYGGRYGMDGMDAVDTLFTNTRNNPIEDIESHFPLRVNRYELIGKDGSGAGKWRGGRGSIRDVEYLDDIGLSVEGDGNVYIPWGIFGGNEGKVGAFHLTPAGSNKLIELPSELPYQRRKKGDIYSLIGPCGGGYGDPLERDPLKVLDDVLDEIITNEHAQSLYGVVINGETLNIDEHATKLLRREMRKKRKR